MELERSRAEDWSGVATGQTNAAGHGITSPLKHSISPAPCAAEDQHQSAMGAPWDNGIGFQTGQNTKSGVRRCQFRSTALSLENLISCYPPVFQWNPLKPLMGCKVLHGNLKRLASLDANDYESCLTQSLCLAQSWLLSRWWHALEEKRN